MSTGGPGPRERDERGRAQNARPRDHLGRPLPRGAAGVPRVPEDLDLPAPQLLTEAQRLLDAGMPFHAHEVLEAGWKAAPEVDRDLWQGLAQLAVGLTHHLRGNDRGAAVLLRRGRGRIAPWSGPAVAAGDAGLPDVDGLLGWSAELLKVLDARVAAAVGTAPVPPRSPRLRRPTAGPPGGPADRLRLERRAMTPDEAAGVVAWRYPPPHDRHEVPQAAAADLVRRSPGGDEGYEPVLDGEAVVAFVCLGPEATVPGQPHRAAGATAEDGVLDVGLGVRPDLLGRGVGSAALHALLLALAASPSAPRTVRAVAREEDPRALALLARAGLRAHQRFGATPAGAAGPQVLVEMRARLADLVP
ncbi:DUF309 domain-containing protein [Pseudokineococcus sp. 1T1Z-3]|uniref:DUF309 domain-containing protein n=1 Tax=Pseudokineococcus sp. 1T1Z-3 TaxID=3132745 RepID=UPI0030A507F8